MAAARTLRLHQYMRRVGTLINSGYYDPDGNALLPDVSWRYFPRAMAVRPAARDMPINIIVIGPACAVFVSNLARPAEMLLDFLSPAASES